MEKFVEFIGVVVLWAILLVGLALIMAFPTMWLVNYLFSDAALVAVFGTSAIGFWKAVCLNFFFGIAFKSSSSSSSKKS